MTGPLPFMNRFNQSPRAFLEGHFKVLLSSMALAISAHGQTQPEGLSSEASVEVVEYDFSKSRGTLIYFDHERLVLNTDGATTKAFNPNDIALVRINSVESPVSNAQTSTYPGRIWLTDGSHYSTEPIFRRGRLIWKNEMVGQIRASLDQIIAYNRSSIVFPESSPNDDLVVLKNGDRIEGLIDRIEGDLFIEQVDGSMNGIPLDRVGSFALINDPMPDSTARLWSVNGDKIAFDSFRYEQGLGLIFGERRIHVSDLPDQVVGFAYNVDRMTPLADLPVETSGITGQLRYHNPAPVNDGGFWPFDAPPMQISGPIRLEWDLPGNDLGLIATAVLPPAFRKHGSVELVISDESGELLRRVLTREDPTCDIRIRIRGDRLIMELHENGDGPIQDSIRLDQAILLGSQAID